MEKQLNKRIGLDFWLRAIEIICITALAITSVWNINLLRTQMNLQLRPWISIKAIANGSKLSLTYRNTGHTPAMSVQMGRKIGIEKPLISKKTAQEIYDNLQNKKVEVFSVIYPGEEKTTREIDIKDWQKYNIFFVSALLIYKDTYGRRYNSFISWSFQKTDSIYKPYVEKTDIDISLKY